MQVFEDQLMMVSKDQIIKGKRTKRQRLPSPLRLTIMPSNSKYSSNVGEIDFLLIDQHDRSEEEKDEEEDMANCLILLAQGHQHQSINLTHVSNHHNNNFLYECKTCNRCFPSFQSLGGHRASHNKPNKTNCNNIVKHQKEEAVTTTFDNPTMNTILSLRAFSAANTTTTTKKSKVHECLICATEFSSGQALGGHMRRHRTLVNSLSKTATTISLSIGSPKSTHSHEAKKPKNVLKLDLNLPAPEVEQSKFSFQPRENVIAFSNSSNLVDCHY